MINPGRRGAGEELVGGSTTMRTRMRFRAVQVIATEVARCSVRNVGDEGGAGKAPTQTEYGRLCSESNEKILSHAAYQYQFC